MIYICIDIPHNPMYLYVINTIQKNKTYELNNDIKDDEKNDKKDDEKDDEKNDKKAEMNIEDTVCTLLLYMIT